MHESPNKPNICLYDSFEGLKAGALMLIELSMQAGWLQGMLENHCSTSSS